MNELDNRKRTAEALFVDEQNRAFRERAEQLRYIGSWAAGLQGLDEAAAVQYATEIANLCISHTPAAVADAARTRISADLGKLASPADLDERFTALKAV